MLWFKKKRKKVHRVTGPIFKNQLTRTKVFFIPGLNRMLVYLEEFGIWSCKKTILTSQSQLLKNKSIFATEI